MTDEIRQDEKLVDLQCKGLKLIQKKAGFRFGIDAVLLAHFAQIVKNSAVIDLGAGTGIISLLLAAKKEPRKITGLEIQQEIAEMAARSVELNGLGKTVEIIRGDIKEAVGLFGPSAFNAVVTNPPYMEKGGGLLNPDDSKAVARHELLCTLEDILSVSVKILKPGGKIFMVHRPHRLADIICRMRDNGIEPKLLRFVHPSPGKKPCLLLAGGAKNGNPGLRVLEPLYVYDGDGNYSNEINRIYGREA